MAVNNNGSNQDFTNSADGFVLGGGITERKLTLTGGNAAITGSGSAVITLPGATDTLVGRASTDTLTNKTISTGGSNSVSSAVLTNPYKFSVYRNSALASGSIDTVVQFDTKRFDTGSNVDVTTNKGRFTAPVAGFYYFSAALGTTGGGSTVIDAGFSKNGSPFIYGYVIPSSAGFRSSIVSLMSLAANDYVEVFLNGAGTAISVGITNNTFDGFLVSIT